MRKKKDRKYGRKLKKQIKEIKETLFYTSENLRNHQILLDEYRKWVKNIPIYVSTKRATSCDILYRFEIIAPEKDILHLRSDICVPDITLTMTCGTHSTVINEGMKNLAKELGKNFAVKSRKEY